ncbi:hypothetical protein BH24ACT3_BH24ACT3_08910 [soil metagenome]
MTSASMNTNLPSGRRRSRFDRRLPNAAHESHPWQIHDIVPDFTLEDVWSLPADGGAEDFATLVEIMTSGDNLMDKASLPARVLWQARDRLGAWFGLDRISAPFEGDGVDALPVPGTDETSLYDRLPDDLRGTAADLHFDSVPFAPLYRTDDEFAAELSNRTVHAVMHLAWVAQGADRFQGEMAVYVKPRGALGQAYMALIKPFRYLIVYPALIQQLERSWNERASRRAPLTP